MKQLAGIVDLRGYEQLKLQALYWEKEFVRARQAEVRAHPNANKAVQELNLERVGSAAEKDDRGDIYLQEDALAYLEKIELEFV